MNKKVLIKTLFVILIITFLIPSIIYIINNKTVYNFNEFYTFFFCEKYKTVQAIIYIVILLLITIVYFTILKNNKKLFNNIKEILKYIVLISILCMLVIPTTSSDVYYYLGIGRLDSTYNQNPYNISMDEFVPNNQEKIKDDTALLKGKNYWGDTTVVYGPVWTLVCKILSGLSFGNVDIGLILFKILNAIIHLINCYIIYKISHKKIFVLMYGLNPFILLEGIVNVHNDMLMIMLILLSLYFLLKKKNILLSVIFLGIATALKYFAILLLPFILIYYFRKEKPSIRFKNCILYGLVFVLVILAIYLLYIQDMNVLKGIFTQQNKYAKSLNLVFFLLKLNLEILKTAEFIIFTLIYAAICIKMLFAKEIRFRKIMKQYNMILVIFTFILITNFQPWYIMWLFPTIMWQKTKNIKTISEIAIASQIANVVFYIFGENYTYGAFYILILLSSMSIIYLYNSKVGRRKLIGKIVIN